jgi:hypothetical protein
MLPRVLLLLLASASLTLAGTPEVPKNPATIDVEVSPRATAPGGAVEVTVQLAPKSGIKLNRYPKIRLKVAAVDGVTEGAEVAVGNERPPAPDRLEDNYYKGSADPLQLELKLDPSVKPGKHEVEAKLIYAYCVKASGFCTRKTEPVTIPVSVSAN